MVNDERFTAYSGLYYTDCIPSNRGLFEIAGSLDELLIELRFDEYAAMKADGNPVFREYPGLLRPVVNRQGNASFL